jgi:hypothetical protein
MSWLGLLLFSLSIGMRIVFLMPNSSAAATQLVTSQLVSKRSNECFFPNCKRKRCMKNEKLCMFCSRGCLILWQVMLARTKPPIEVAFQNTALCMRNGCRLPRYKDPFSAMCYSYCGRRCAITDKNNKNVPRLVYLDTNNIEYARVSSVFQSTMGKQVASLSIYQIQMAKRLQERYYEFDEQNGSSDRPLEYFHGTTFNETIRHSDDRPCGTSQCKVCGILQHGFLLSCAISGRLWTIQAYHIQWFNEYAYVYVCMFYLMIILFIIVGPKFWLARRSAISHRYAHNNDIKAIFLCNVIKNAVIQESNDIITVGVELVSTCYTC